jgi:hypothetical protein
MGKPRRSFKKSSYNPFFFTNGLSRSRNVCIKFPFLLEMCAKFLVRRFSSKPSIENMRKSGNLLLSQSKDTDRMLQERMSEDGYVLLDGLLDRTKVTTIQLTNTTSHRSGCYKMIAGRCMRKVCAREYALGVFACACLRRSDSLSVAVL